MSDGLWAIALVLSVLIVGWLLLNSMPMQIAAPSNLAPARPMSLDQYKEQNLPSVERESSLPSERKGFGKVQGAGRDNVSLYASPEDAQRAGAKKYTSGPCKGYYQGEEQWCNPGRERDQ